MTDTDPRHPTPSDACPCGADLPYEDCCAPLHRGEPALTPEALMRSRYSAFVRNDTTYVARSWHPDTRPTGLMLDDGDHWLELRVLDSDSDGDRGRVHFRALRRRGKGFSVLEEHSRFVREDGHWFYVDGDSKVSNLKPGRNEPCPCGSGKKFKKCCAA
ncbi:YchJ family protein [Alloalcanivorax sp. C16-1]|uniref:YchJ family protein n=1 Tax=Alloalcanivorax sp. C16-1 TaxID=3390051 RepID=UPI003970FD67